MKSIIISIFVCVFIVVTGFQAYGEELTAEQKEVWNAVVADIENFKTGKFEKVMEARHDNFVGWYFNEKEIKDKVWARLYYKGWFNYDVPSNWELQPVKILIMGNVANAYYSFQFKGEKTSSKGRAVDTFVKENIRWLMVSHVCTSCEQPSNCK